MELSQVMGDVRVFRHLDLTDLKTISACKSCKVDTPAGSNAGVHAR